MRFSEVAGESNGQGCGLTPEASVGTGQAKRQLDEAFPPLPNPSPARGEGLDVPRMSVVWRAAGIRFGHPLPLREGGWGRGGMK